MEVSGKSSCFLNSIYIYHFLKESTFHSLPSFLNLDDTLSVHFSHSVMSDSVIPSTAALQASLFITNSQSPLKLMSIELVMPSNHLIPCHPLLLLPSVFPSIRVFPNESVLHIRWPKSRVSASASVLLVNIQNWFPLGLTGLISLQFKGLSTVFFNTTVWKHQFFGTQPSLWSNSHVHTWPLEKSQP